MYGYECKRAEGGQAAVMVKVEKTGNEYSSSVTSSHATNVLRSTVISVRNSFLPVGYPTSVRPEYMTYQMYDSLQALCSYLRGVLCVHAVLVGAGVGQESGNAMAAALAWVLKDGVGMLASILFASSCSTFFAVYMKEWRLFADVINDVGQLLDMLSALVPARLYLVVLSLSAICKAFCGVAAGATKLCITNHLARTNNAADLVTKEGTQETAVTLCGLLLGMLCAQSIASDPLNSMVLFLFLTAIHVWANYRAVYVLHVESINPSRGFLLAERVVSILMQLEQKSRPVMKAEISSGEQIVSALSADDAFDISQINDKECLTNTFRTVYWTRQMHFGCSLTSALNDLNLPLPKNAHSTLPQEEEAAVGHVMRAFRSSAFGRCAYCLLPRGRGGLSVLLTPSAQPVDIFRAFVHCRLLQVQALSSGACSSAEDIIHSIDVMNTAWIPVLAELTRKGWDLSEHGISFNCDEWVFSVCDEATLSSPETKKVQ